MGKARGRSTGGGSDAGAPGTLLSRVALREPSGAAADEFPFTVASLRGLGAVELPADWRDPMMAGLLGVQSGEGTAADAFSGVSNTCVFDEVNVAFIVASSSMNPGD